MLRSILDKDVLMDGTSFFKQLREQKPVYFDKDVGMFVVTRAEDITRVLRNPDTFSLALAIAHTYPFKDVVEDVMTRNGLGLFERILPQAEPPAHSRVRSLVSKGFSTPRISKMHRQIDDLTNSYIDGFIDQGSTDIAATLAQPLSLSVIGDLLMLPPERHDQVRTWTKAWMAASVGGFQSAEDAKDAATALTDMQHYLVEKLQERRRKPVDDMMTDLINARSGDHQPLNDREIIAFGAHLLGAGHETTSVAITSAIKLLAENPSQVEAIRAAEQSAPIIRAFIEEVLRLEPPTNTMTRVSTADATVGEVNVPAGSRVALIIGSANRDEATFGEAADDFEPGRKGANRHMTFGAGVHVCLGNMLARAELASVVKAVVDRMDHLQLCSEAPAAFADYEKVVFPTNFRPVKLEVRYQSRVSEQAV